VFQDEDPDARLGIVDSFSKPAGGSVKIVVNVWALDQVEQLFLRFEN